MKIHSVKLVNFKSIGDYDKNEVIVEPRITAILGKNESGKSNILEGLSYIKFTVKNDVGFHQDLLNMFHCPSVVIFLQP